jgi:hypothetical protein
MIPMRVGPLPCGVTVARLHALHDRAESDPALHAHAAGCPHCGAELALLERLSTSLGAPAEAPPASVWHVIARRAAQRRHARAAAVAWAFASAAAALCVWVAVGIVSDDAGAAAWRAVSVVPEEVEAVSEEAALGFALHGELAAAEEEW